MDNDQQPALGSQDSDGDTTDLGRRKAMVRMAAYTAPVMLATLVGEKAMAASASDPGSGFPFPCEIPL